MLTLAASPFSLTSKSVLHLVYPADEKNPNIARMATATKAHRYQRVYVGNHYLSPNVFRQFETVIVHDCQMKYIIDYLQRLRDYTDRFHRIINDSSRNLVIVGNTLGITAHKVLLLNHVQNPRYNAITKSAEIDDTTRGLGITEYRWNTITREQLLNDQYARTLCYAARKEPIYLLSMNAVYPVGDKVLFGDMFQVTGHDITPIARMPAEPNMAVDQQVRERTLSSEALRLASNAASYVGNKAADAASDVARRAINKVSARTVESSDSAGEIE